MASTSGHYSITYCLGLGVWHVGFAVHSAPPNSDCVEPLSLGLGVSFGV